MNWKGVYNLRVESVIQKKADAKSRRPRNKVIAYLSQKLIFEPYLPTCHA